MQSKTLNTLFYWLYECQTIVVTYPKSNKHSNLAKF